MNQELLYLCSVNSGFGMKCWRKCKMFSVFEEIVCNTCKHFQHICGHVTVRQSSSLFATECLSQCVGDMGVLGTDGNYFLLS